MNVGLSLADQIRLELRADIIGGRLLPGMPLVENELAGSYNASRNTIREALHCLGQEGLTRYVRHKGVMVRRLERDDLRDLFRVRRTLELQAIASARPLRECQSGHMLDAIEAAELARDREDWRAVGTHGLVFTSMWWRCWAHHCWTSSSPMWWRSCAWCFAPRQTRRCSRPPGWSATGRSMGGWPTATRRRPERPWRVTWMIPSACC